MKKEMNRTDELLKRIEDLEKIENKNIQEFPEQKLLLKTELKGRQECAEEYEKYLEDYKKEQREIIRNETLQEVKQIINKAKKQVPKGSQTEAVLYVIKQELGIK